MKHILKFLGKIVTLLAVAYIVYYIYSIDFDFQLVKDWPTFFFLVCGGAVISATFVFGMGKAWSNILKGLAKQPIDTRMAIRVYAKANVGKYLPGNVMHYVERNLFAVNAGMGQVEIMLSSILEIAIIIFTTGMIVCIFMHGEAIEILSKYVSAMWIFVGLLILIGLIFAVSIILKKKPQMRVFLVRLCSKDIGVIALKNVFFYSFQFFIMGVFLVAVLKIPLACEISIQMSGYIIVSYIMAWVIGFVVPGAPGGIGVREFVLITLLGTYFLEEYIVFALVVHRIVTVFGDVLAYLVAVVFLQNGEQINSL